MEETANFIITILATMEIKNVYGGINIFDIMSVKIPMLPYVLQCYGLGRHTSQDVMLRTQEVGRRYLWPPIIGFVRLRETTFQHIYCFFGFVSPHNG